MIYYIQNCIMLANKLGNGYKFRKTGNQEIVIFSIYTPSDLGVLSNLIIGSLSLANEHYSSPTE